MKDNASNIMFDTLEESFVKALCEVLELMETDDIFQYVWGLNDYNFLDEVAYIIKEAKEHEFEAFTFLILDEKLTPLLAEQLDLISDSQKKKEVMRRMYNFAANQARKARKDVDQIEELCIINDVSAEDMELERKIVFYEAELESKVGRIFELMS